jgi:hypothetical protein
MALTKFDLTLEEAIKIIKKRNGISNDFDTELAEAAVVLLGEYENLKEDYNYLYTQMRYKAI